MKEIRLNLMYPELPPMVNHRQLCLECDIAEFALYYGKPYSLPLCEYVDFEYDSNRSKKLSERFSVEKSILDQYDKYGIVFTKEFVKNKNKYSEYLTDKINSGAPVIVHLDCYYVPWDKGYKGYHNNHTLLVAGERDDAYFISDPYFKKSGWVSKDEFHDGSKYFFEINFDVSEMSHRNVLSEKFERMLGNGYFKNLERFSEDLRIARLSPEEQENITRLMGIVELNKQKFMMFLYEWENTERHHDYTSEYGKIWSQWQVLKVMSLRAKYRKYDQMSLQKLSDHIMTVRKDEEKVLERFASCIEPRQKTVSEHIVGELDIFEYCNNKGLVNTLNDGVADCTGFGEFICIGNKASEIRSLGYKLFADRSRDNILCCGQDIALPRDFAGDEIKLLVVAEWGDYVKAFGLEYTDGTADEITFTIRDWAVSDSGRMDIGSSYYIEDGRGKQFRDSVYADEIELKPSPNKTPKRIILPECSNIHILAIKHCKGASNE